MTCYEDLVRKIDRLKSRNKRIIVAIDGPCASGKTTLSKVLSKHFFADVLHMDDYFLPPNLRTPERYSTPGGNVHYERFLEEVLIPISEGRPYVYRPFHCKTMSFGDATESEPALITIVEGSYSLHPALASYYDLRVFLSIESSEQTERLLRRNGEEKTKEFISKWIPLENLYISGLNIKESADMVVELKGELL